MKCELCHNKEAETVLMLNRNGVEEELYVCKACANMKRLSQQKKSQRTRKIMDLPPGMSVSIEQIGTAGNPPPQMVEALMNAMSNAMSNLKRQLEPVDAEKDVKKHTFPCSRVDVPFKVAKRLHLEGLNLIGELDAAKRAFRAMGMSLDGVVADGVSDVGHVYSVSYTGSSERVKRVIGALIDQECNARVRLFEEMPRILGDAVSRSLAILKNCRLLSPAEYFDLLSPLRIAAIELMLDGITLEKIDSEMNLISLESEEDKLPVTESDKVDAARADKINKVYEDVVLNERAEEKFL